MLVPLLLISILIYCVYWILYGSFGYWKQRDVPHPEPQALVGNLGGSISLKKHLVTIYTDIYNTYKNCSWVGIYKFRDPAVLLRDADVIKDILTKDFSSFHDNDIDIDENKNPLFGKNPFVLKGGRWKFIRSQITSAITTGKLKNMFSIMSKTSKSLVEYLNKEAVINNKEGLNAKDFSVMFTTDVVAACAFGLEGNSFTDPDSQFFKMGSKIFNPVGIDKYKQYIVFAFPKLAKFIGFNVISPNIQNWFIETLRKTIKYREENNIVRNDYLDLMLSLKKKSGEYEFTEMDVMAQSMTFYGDGMETSATALSFILFEIAKNPDVQEKLRQEIDDILAAHKGELSYDAIQEMQYVDRVVSESLRLYPPAAYLQKRCTKQFTLPPPRGTGTGPGVVVDPGMSILIPVMALHHDPQYYPDPESFNPDRFTEEEKKNRPKCVYLPFGEGPRQCLGFRFALMQIKAAIVGVISNFEIELNKNTTRNVELDPEQFLVAKKGGIYLDVKKRAI